MRRAACRRNDHFQTVPFVRASTDEGATSLTIGDNTLILGVDYLPATGRLLRRTFNGARAIYELTKRDGPQTDGLKIRPKP